MHIRHPPTLPRTLPSFLLASPRRRRQVLGKSLFDLQDPWMSYVTNGLKAKELLIKDKDYIVRGACVPRLTPLGATGWMDVWGPRSCN